MSDELDALLERIRAHVTPDDDERAAMRAVAQTVIDRAEAALADRSVEGDVIRVGSTARGTWLSGDRDIDVFIRFPQTLSRDDLEEHGLAIGHAVLPDGQAEYAEHPYVTGEVDGFDVDLVPCYAVDSADEIRSSVDRTPFHTTYLEQRLDETSAGDVRVAKQFLTGIGAYGSDLRTRGFSGFLTELLVLEYGGVRSFLSAAADWQPPISLDPEAHGKADFDAPLSVIDPTDPERNVAAVVSEANVARVIHYARSLVADPDPSVFVPGSRSVLSPVGVRAAVTERASTPVAAVFDAPSIVDDQLYPQLRRSLDGLCRGLEKAGFSVLRATSFADDERAVLLVEPTVTSLPAVERHAGPPVSVSDHASEFYARYASDQVVGPFIDEDRYVVERSRSIRTVERFLTERLPEVSLGVQVRDEIEAGYTVLAGPEIGTLAPRFGRALSRYFSPCPRGDDL